MGVSVEETSLVSRAAYRISQSSKNKQKVETKCFLIPRIWQIPRYRDIPTTALD